MGIGYPLWTTNQLEVILKDDILLENWQRRY